MAETKKNGFRNVTLWKTDRSPACRAVMMALDAMGLSVNEIDVNMDRGEHRKAQMFEVCRARSPL